MTKGLWNRLIKKEQRDSSSGSASRTKTYRKFRARRIAAPLISLTLLVCALLPAFAHAGVISDIISFITGQEAEVEVKAASNLQTLSLPRPAMNIDPSASRGGGDIVIVDKTALMPEEGPSGTIADIQKPKSGTVSRYVVRPGDTLSGIAKMFNVTANTIMWGNNISRATELQVGQILVILPIPGIEHTVQKGDTIASIAKKYGGDADEIVAYNELQGVELTIGQQITIPNGEKPQAPAPVKSSSGSTARAHDVGPAGTAQQIGYYMRPVNGGVRTQGIHGYNGVDLASAADTPIMASAAGDVVIAREGGWNGGYGNYVVIQHGNGSQTLYAHLSRLIVGDGQRVVQGQVIGYMGRTGKSTGVHLHFEIRNGIRNPF